MLKAFTDRELHGQAGSQAGKATGSRTYIHAEGREREGASERMWRAMALSI